MAPWHDSLELSPPPVRLAGLVAALALAAAALFSPVVARAAGSVDTWDGKADTSWYDENPTADRFTLDSAEDLAGLSELTNQQNPVTFTGKTILLATDIDLAGHDWTAISQDGMNSVSTSFSGTFDGQGHVIHNLKNVPSTEYRYGLFGTVHTATIRNLGLEAAMVIESENNTRLEIGPLVSWSSTSIVENCWVTGSLYTPGGYIVGGLVGQCTGNSQVIECSSSTDVTVGGLSGPCVGGVVGQWETTGNDSLIADCYFDGSIEIASGTSANGGILGGCFEEKGPTVRNCIVLTTAISQPTFTSFLGVFPEGTSIEHCLWPTGAYIQEGGSAESGPYRFPYGFFLPDSGQVGFDPDPATFPTEDAADDAYGTIGRNIADFSNPALIEELNQYASQGVSWAMGIDGHPVLATQTHLIAADYSGVDAALATIPDLSLYTAESAAAVTTARDAVDRTLTADQQTQVDDMAAAIEAAVDALEKLANYDAVDTAVAKANVLDRSRYTEETLAKLDAAVAAVVRGYGETRQDEVDDMAAAIEAALAALEEVPSSGTQSGDPLAATGDPTVLLAPATALAGGTVLLARRKVA